MTISYIDPHTTFPRSLLESNQGQHRLDRPVLEQDLLFLEDRRKREEALRKPPTTQKAQDKILREKEREEKRRERRGSFLEKREGLKEEEEELSPFMEVERGRIVDQRV